ncbi:MAG: hypothetical protein F9K29_18920 [Hyphomicrobiaceae bacterium]|nr:MAG: hypothetical protein F9K29_18920 [Hyphomicrobiaceae bacterium]
MAELTDETLMAYADGALDPAACAAVEAELAAHPEYRRKLDAFRATSAPLARAFRQGMAEGNYDHLIADIRQGELELKLRPIEAAARAPRVGGMGRPHVSALRRYFPTAMAAGVAMLIGVGLGWLALPPPAPTAAPGFLEFVGGNVLAQGELRGVLESARSGTSVVARSADGQAWTVKASFTFRSTSQLPCRQYVISSDAAGRYAGYACRSGDGRWLVQAHVAMAPKASESKGYVPADGDGNAALNAAVHAVMDGDVMQTDEENSLISRQWASDRK